MLERYKSFQPKPKNIDELKKVLQSAVYMRPAATGLDQQNHTELPEKTSGLCESWWWTPRTACQILAFVITMFNDNDGWRFGLVVTRWLRST